jgi:hypothetical protein
MPSQDPKKRCLPRAVGPDEPNPLAGAHLELHILKDGITGKLSAQAAGSYQNHG